MSIKVVPKVALLWHGDRAARNTATLEDSRFRSVAEALRQIGIEVEPAVYADEYAAEVRDQLLKVHGALVWVNPIEQGCDRTALDSMLRQVADEGVLVSAHPEVILKMGTKDVLFHTRNMGWGGDTYLYTTAQELREQLPVRLAAGKPRVLKQYRGNGGNGVWKVEEHPTDRTLVRVRHALRGSVEEDLPLSEFLARCEQYYSGAGHIIDQVYQERLTEGMIRCYLVRDQVVGFGHQLVNALFPPFPGAPPETAPQPGPRLYYPATKPDFQVLGTKMEKEWVPTMQQVLDIDAESLPVIWDADFLYGPKTSAGEDTYVLCETNVSSVYPFPDDALKPLAREVYKRLLRRIPHVV